MKNGAASVWVRTGVAVALVGLAMTACEASANVPPDSAAARPSAQGSRGTPGTAVPSGAVPAPLAPTDAPATATPANAPAPALQATAAVTRLAAPAISVHLSSTTTNAGRSSTVAIRGTTIPGASCTIAVTEAGSQATPQGLGPQTADGAGDVSWTWTVTTTGSWRVAVACGGSSATAQFTLQ